MALQITHWRTAACCGYSLSVMAAYCLTRSSIGDSLARDHCQKPLLVGRLDSIRSFVRISRTHQEPRSHQGSWPGATPADVAIPTLRPRYSRYSCSACSVSAFNASFMTLLHIYDELTTINTLNHIP